MTEVEFLNRFSAPADWRVGVHKANQDGRSQWSSYRWPGDTLQPGRSVMGLDLAKELDHSVSKEGMTDA